jgi:hypothetical protein
MTTKEIIAFIEKMRPALDAKYQKDVDEDVITVGDEILNKSLEMLEWLMERETDLTARLEAEQWVSVKDRLPEETTGLWAVLNAVGTITLTCKCDRKLWLFAFTHWKPISTPSKDQ